MNNPIIEVTGVGKSFGPVHALSDINLKIAPGEIVTLLGPSGCGKTTLMRLIAGFDTATAGTIYIEGKDVAKLPPEKRPVNMVFQRYALFPHLDVFDNIAFGLKVKGVPAAEIRQRVNQMLHIVQLEEFGRRYIDEISGGQSQRVALARALVNEPKVLLLDEPLAALDLKVRQHMLREMKRIHKETGATFVYVTHDQDEAMVLSDHVVLMDKGRIVQVDRPEDMYARPKSVFAAKFLGETNMYTATINRTGPDGTVALTPEGIQFVCKEPEARLLNGEILASVRPESLTFLKPSNGQWGSTEARVDDIVFMGSRSIYHMLMPSGGRVVAQVQGSNTRELPIKGSIVKVFWMAESVVFLPLDVGQRLEAALKIEDR
jgi:spermidine/putrescine transport system ATP-binding protein